MIVGAAHALHPPLEGEGGEQSEPGGVDARQRGANAAALVAFGNPPHPVAAASRQRRPSPSRGGCYRARIRDRSRSLPA